MTRSSEQLSEEVRARYADAARNAAEGKAGCGCGSGEGCFPVTGDAVGGDAMYATAELRDVPDAAAQASLGCGNPTAIAELHEGETVLDLGSGAGLDVILSARRVGPTGIAFGLDMTEEMLALARRNAEEAGVRNAIFLKGVMEDVPLPAGSVDVVISNCVVNLSVDKPAVFAELARVLRPRGRLGIADIVADDRLTSEERAERGSFVGCIAGALAKGEYEEALQAAGFVDVSVSFMHEVTDGMYSAAVAARKPVTPPRPRGPLRDALPLASSARCC